MGQYYKPTILNADGKVQAYVYSHDYDNGLKLMEHSWVGNTFVNAFASQLIPNAPFYKSPVVWAGDYADEDFYSQCNDNNRLHPDSPNIHESHPFIVNHTTGQYVDIRKTPLTSTMQIHPLPILTAVGNGRGGGDLYAIESGDESLIGRWAKDVISCETTPPDDFEEIIFDLVEAN